MAIVCPPIRVCTALGRWQYGNAISTFCALDVLKAAGKRAYVHFGPFAVSFVFWGCCNVLFTVYAAADRTLVCCYNVYVCASDFFLFVHV